MSGGSFNYLFMALDGIGSSPAELLALQLHDLEEMGKALNGLDYAQEAAQDTAELIAAIRAVNLRAGALRDAGLGDVWWQVERMRSNDGFEFEVRSVATAYREQRAQNERVALQSREDRVESPEKEEQ